MDQPKHCQLLHARTKWLFRSGRGPSLKFIELVDFEAFARDMIKQVTLFQGHRKFKDILHLRSVIQLKAAVANHVSAKRLSSLISPSSVQAHSSLNANDKHIWDKACLEELNGLKANNTWDTISEDKYNSIRHKVKALLPTMAISTIKFDSNGKPKRTKYRIVALGNLHRVH